MVKIYVSLDSENHVTGWGEEKFGPITVNPEDSFLIDIVEDHPLLNADLDFSYKGGQLYRDSSSTLADRKRLKISSLTDTCKEDILSGFEAEVEDKPYHFSYSLPSQANLSERLSLFQNDIVDELKITAHDLEANKEVRLIVDKEMFKHIYIASVKAKEDKIAKLKDVLIPRVEQAQSIDEVNLVNWGDISVVPEEPNINLKQDNMIDKKVEATVGDINDLAKELSISNEALLEMAFNLL